MIRTGLELGAHRARPGDAVLVNGVLGDHGAAILAARGDLALDAPIDSDCAALHGLVDALLAAVPGTRFMRDATRGGVATVLNEIAIAAGCGIETRRMPPCRCARQVKGFCEILGLDPLYLANEGRLVAIVPPADADRALAAMRAHPLGAGACRIGHVTERRPRQVVMRTVLGGQRIVDMLVGDQLPRIC